MAGKARKTEHHGPKRGTGSYWGRKKDAKRDSNKKRRQVGRTETDQAEKEPRSH